MIHEITNMSAVIINKQVNYNRYLQNILSMFLSLFFNLLKRFAHNRLKISYTTKFAILVLLLFAVQNSSVLSTKLSALSIVHQMVSLPKSVDWLLRKLWFNF